jgi:hypothetical protein
MTTPELWKLPAALRTYNVKHLPLDLTTASQECFICYRHFGDKDDPDDALEIACEPLELQPCKHIMGSGCFRKVIDMGMDTCQLCRTKIVAIDDPVPQWLQYMTSTQWFTYQIDATRGLLPKFGGTGQHFDELCEMLFQGNMELSAVLALWCHCMVAPVASLVNLTLLMSVVQVALFPFARVYENRFVELFSYSVGLIFAGFLTATGIAPSHSRLWNELLLGLCMKVLTLFVGWKGFVALLVAHCFIYAAVAGSLIGYGVVLRSKIQR